MSEQEEVDRQEASSARYVCGLRLLRLSSGAWAVFHGGEQGLSELEIRPQLSLEWLEALAGLEQHQRLRLEERYLQQRAALLEGQGNSKTEKTMEDMGL